MFINIRLNLAPKWRSGAAASYSDSTKGYFHLREDLKRVAQAERDAFEYRANYVCSCVVCREADQTRARVRIKVRRALSHQIRGPQDATCARRNLRCFFRQ